MSKIAVIGIAGESVFLTLDAFGKVGETVTASALHRELGGKGFNQAVAAARYGHACAFLGASHHGDAERFSAIARERGITPYFVPKEDESPYAVITTDASGDNRVSVYRGAVLDERDVDAFADEIASADLLLLNNEVPHAVNERAVEIAKENGVFVLLNPAPARAYSAEFLKKIDLFTPNEHETEGLDGFDNVVLTLGKRGAKIVSTGEIIPAVDAGDAVDTTGAGDTFTGVLAAATAAGLSLRDACKRASVAAAIKVSRKYILDSIPSIKEIENFEREQKNGSDVF